MMLRWIVVLVLFFFVTVAHAQDVLGRDGTMDSTAMTPSDPTPSVLPDSVAAILDPGLKAAAASLSAGYPMAAAAELRDILLQNPTHTQALRLLISAHLRAENFDQAIAACQQLTVLDSTDAGVLIALGYLHQRLGAAALAEQFYHQGLGLDPSIITAYQNLGWLYLKTERAEQTLDMVDETTDRAPDYAPNYILLGRALSVQGLFEDAAIAYNRAFALQSGLREHYGILLQELGLRHPLRQ